MNNYYVVYEKEKKVIGGIEKTIYDLNTYKGLLSFIDELQEKEKCEVLIHSWKPLS